jgi:hypothetical protein
MVPPSSLVLLTRNIVACGHKTMSLASCSAAVELGVLAGAG